MDRHTAPPEHLDSDDDSHTSPPPPPHPAPGVLERFLTTLFESRLLSDAPASAATPPSLPHPPPPPANTAVPFFSTASILDTPMQRPHPVVFCVEDTVGLKDDKYSVGVVDRAFGDVDSHEPRPQRDYGEDIECHADVSRDEFAKFMKSGIPPRGAVLVSWQTHLKTELVPEAQLQLLDRALYVGDVVKRHPDEHMSGTVIGTRAACTLFPATQYNGGHITQTISDDLSIRNVPADEVLNVHEYNEGAIVVYGDWVGRVENVYDEVAVKLSNNSVVIVEDPSELEQEETMVERLSIGDPVKTKKGNLRRGRWKYGAFDPHIRPEGTVVETRTVEIDVQWLARSISASNTSLSAEEPPATLGPDEFESSTFYRYDASGSAASTLPLSSNGTDRQYHVTDVAVGDRVRFKDITGAAVKYDGTHNLPNGYPQGKLTRVARTESLGYDLNVFLVMQTHTQVTVQWQDLTVTEDLSIALLPDPNVEDDDEVWPGEVVCSKESGRSDDPSRAAWAKKPAKVGVVQAVKSRDRIAQVRWFSNPLVEFFGPDLLRPSTTGALNEQVEDVSLYDIYSFPALTRRRNDFVLIHPDSVQSLQAPLDVDGPAWFGEVVDLSLDGKLTVRLGAAKPVIDVQVSYEGVTLAYSSDMDNEFLNMHGMEDDSLDDSEDDEISDFDSESFNEMWIEYEGMEGEPPEGEEGEWSTEDEEDDSDDDISMPDLIEQDELDTSKTTPENKSPVIKDEQKDASEPMPDAASPMAEDDADASPDFPSPFLILDTPPPANHHFLHQMSASSSTFMRRIAKEHKILRTSLPSNIFVRTWDSRLDLLRVLIIGPSDTPYEYAPFVIDFHLSSTYPQTAPEAYFHSWTNSNGPVNPNLYEDGKICLSLLGTWHTDERNESWSPAKSTLLQVLVSILGLVLVKEPYYNEAGYDVHREAPETKLSSALYTERAYFRARAFIAHALSNEVQPFAREIEYLYKSHEEGAPRLLDKAIERATEVVTRSRESGGAAGERDGLRTMSLGAVVMLERQVKKLVSLRDSAVTS